MIPFASDSNRESVLHRLDPWTKLSIVFGMFGVIFFFPAPGFLLCLGLFLMVLVKIAGISIGYMLYRLKFLLWFFIFGNLFYFFFTPGRVLCRIPEVGLTLTQEGVSRGVTMILQLCLMAILSFLVLNTTSRVKLVKCIQTVFYPLYRIGVSVPDITLMMIMSFRFIPLLLSEGKRIVQIQMLRAGEIERGVFGYARNLVPLITPIFLSAVRKAQIMALAAEQRGYTGEVGRHHFYFPRLHRRDGVAFLVVGLFLAGLILMWR